MTLLVSWAAVDTHGVASVYLMADSRLSWDTLGNFDYSRKIFSFYNSPDIIGYCGDALFPSIVLSQVVDMGNRNILFPGNIDCKDKFNIILQSIKNQFDLYPKRKEIFGKSIQFLYLTRDLNSTKFYCYFFTWSKENEWTTEIIAMPTYHSELLKVLGSGGREFIQNYNTRYKFGENSNTSRNIYHCFFDTIQLVKDKYCGGTPQLSRIIRKPGSPANAIGVITNDKRYFLGAELNNNLIDYNNISWVNDLFEISDGNTMKKLPAAQSQPDLLRRKRS